MAIEVTISTASMRGLRAKLERVIKNMESLPKKRQAGIRTAILGGVEENFHRLSRGGSVTTASGSPITWTQNRHPATWSVRRRFGLHGVTPILSFTGKLESGLFGGSFRSSVRAIRYRPRQDTARLIQVHQHGLARLRSKSARMNRAYGAGFRVPKRPMLFWSKMMARDVLEQGKSLMREEVRK